MRIALENRSPKRKGKKEKNKEKLNKRKRERRKKKKEKLKLKLERKEKQVKLKLERKERKKKRVGLKLGRKEREKKEFKTRDNKKRGREEGEWKAKKKPKIEEVDTIELSTAVWPVEIQRLYIDGNNLMFMTQFLRQLTLNGSRHMTEIALSELARLLQEKLGIPFVHVLFDKSTHQLESYAVSRGHESFVVSSSRPIFSTADDQLVHIANQMKQSDGTSYSLFVTSDRELRQRLQQENGKIIGPKRFLQFVFESLNTEGAHENIDGLIQQIIETAGAQ